LKIGAVVRLLERKSICLHPTIRKWVERLSRVNVGVVGWNLVVLVEEVVEIDLV
jgi:hypothetical protein